MTMRLSRDERALYEDAWRLDGYSAFAPGAHYLPAFLAMTTRGDRDTILDAGTGSGKGALALADAGFAGRITCCDLTDSGLVEDARTLPFVEVCLWADVKQAVGPHEWVYCTDVLEHIPTAFTALVIRRLVETARAGVFLSISLVPDQFGALLGRPLHLTVQPFTWWRDLLAEIAEVVECRDLGNVGIYLLRGSQHV